MTLVLLCSAHAAGEATLDSLFDTLQNTRDATVASKVEDEIWACWRNAASEQTLKRLEDAIERLATHGELPALGAYDHMLALDPDYVHGLNARATLLYTMGEFDASLRDIETVLALEPRHFGALYGKALILMLRDEFAASRAALERVEHLNPHAGGLDWAWQRLENREQRVRSETEEP